MHDRRMLVTTHVRIAAGAMGGVDLPLRSGESLLLLKRGSDGRVVVPLVANNDAQPLDLDEVARDLCRAFLEQSTVRS